MMRNINNNLKNSNASRLSILVVICVLTMTTVSGQVQVNDQVIFNQNIDLSDNRIDNVNVLRLTNQNAEIVFEDTLSSGSNFLRFDGQYLEIDNTNLASAPSGALVTKGYVDSVAASAGDGFEANTDNQTLSIAGQDLSISDGNTVTLPAGADGFLPVDGATADVDMAGYRLLNVGGFNSTSQPIDSDDIGDQEVKSQDIEDGSIGMSKLSGGATVSCSSDQFLHWDGTNFVCKNSNKNAGQSCPSGSYVIGFATNGDMLCSNAQTWYEDADGDGYGITSSNITQTTQPPGYAATPGDCYDSNDNAYPGQTGYFATDRGDGSFDYDCDGSETKQYTSTDIYSPNGAFSCNLVGGVTCQGDGTPGSGWVGSVPNCGDSATWKYQACGAPSACPVTEVEDPRDMGCN